MCVLWPDGRLVGCLVGVVVGWHVGCCVSVPDDGNEGCPVGRLEGGWTEGCLTGFLLGCHDSCPVGCRVGFIRWCRCENLAAVWGQMLGYVGFFG
jgi:hypothetical protein